MARLTALAPLRARPCQPATRATRTASTSQVVRFQFRTVLASGRSPKSLKEHEAIVDAITDQDRKATMRRHLSHVAETLMKTASAARVTS
jgi:DNA-binding FadR family transcriptional regulator